MIGLYDDIRVMVRAVPHIICDACGLEICLGAYDWADASPMELARLARVHWDSCGKREGEK